MGDGWYADREHGLASGVGTESEHARVQHQQLARLRRGDAPLRPRARLADALDRARRVDGMDALLRLGSILRPGLRAVWSAVRPSVFAYMDRLSPRAGRLHARARNRL